MKVLKIIVILLLFSHFLYAGDVRYVNIGSWGLGEISNRLLIYHGDAVYQTFIPVGKAWLIAYGAIIATVVSAIAVFKLRLRKK